MATAKKPSAPKAEAKPAAKKPKTVDLLAVAEQAERDLQAIVAAAGEAGGWQQIQAELAGEHAQAAVDARTALAKADGVEYEPGANLTRWL